MNSETLKKTLSALSPVIWAPEEKPCAILQITHGMTEHIGRYEYFAKILNSYGILVAGFDLRGHGKNLAESRCASFRINGWESSIEDIHQFYQLLKHSYPEIPHFMFGFSLGSFLLREYLSVYSEDQIAGAIIAGTGEQPKFLLQILISVIKTQVKKAGFDNTTPLVKKLSFETYNQKFAPNKTAFDWLCSDESELALYCADPMCSDSISSGLFLQLLESMKQVNGIKSYQNWNRKTPILLLSGKNDPVGDFGKGVLQVEKSMNQAHLNCTMELIDDARHDLLHEENSGAAEKARIIIIQWILKQLKNT